MVTEFLKVLEIHFGGILKFARMLNIAYYKVCDCYSGLSVQSQPCTYYEMKFQKVQKPGNDSNTIPKVIKISLDCN